MHIGSRWFISTTPGETTPRATPGFAVAANRAYAGLKRWLAMYYLAATSELNGLVVRLSSFMATGTTKTLIIPYFISIGFTAISINSIARGIKNDEPWRIVTAGIGGSFFLGVAVLMIVRIFKAGRKGALKPVVFSFIPQLKQRLKWRGRRG